MSVKQIIIPRNYTNQAGEEQTFWQNSGRAFIATENNQESYINLYMDAIPFQPDIRIFMKDLPEPSQKSN